MCFHQWFLKRSVSFLLLISNGKSFHKMGPAYLKTEHQGALHLQRQTSSNNAVH